MRNALLPICCMILICCMGSQLWLNAKLREQNSRLLAASAYLIDADGRLKAADEELKRQDANLQQAARAAMLRACGTRL
jgi:hypothetical protein